MMDNQIASNEGFDFQASDKDRDLMSIFKRLKLGF